MLPLPVLSGAMTPRESLPEMIQTPTLAAPRDITPSRGVLFRGAGLGILRPRFPALAAIVAGLFPPAPQRFFKFPR